MPLRKSVFGNPICRRRKKIRPRVGVRGPNPTTLQVSIFRKDAWDKRPYLCFILKRDGSRSEPRSGNPYSRGRKKIRPGVGVRGPHLVPLCPKTYARSFPRIGIVRIRALAFTAVQVLSRKLTSDPKHFKWRKREAGLHVGGGSGNITGCPYIAV
jgi:hypothetical protein